MTAAQADRNPDPSDPGDRPRPDEPAPGLKDQLGTTRSAFQRLIGAHVDLAKAEIGDISSEIGRVAILAGVAFGALLLAGLLLGVGLFLWLDEWIFGSLGWALLHGPLFLAGIAIAAVLVALGYGGGRIASSFIGAVVIGVVVGAVLGLDLTNRAWTALGDAVATNVAPDIRPLVVAAGTLALVFAVLGLVLGGRGGGMGGAIGGALAGAIAGGLLGVLTAIALGPRVGAAIGLTVGLVAWSTLMGVAAARQGVDTEALKARFWPKQTIDTTKETIEWVRKRTPLGPRS
jgi:MFS family permease